MRILFIQYSGEDLLIAIDGCDESGFSAARTRRRGMAICHVPANDETFRSFSVWLGRRLAASGVCKKRSPELLSNNYVGRRPMRVCALGRRTGSRMAEDVLY